MRAAVAPARRSACGRLRMWRSLRVVQALTFDLFLMFYSVILKHIYLNIKELFDSSEVELFSVYIFIYLLFYFTFLILIVRS